VCFLLLFVSFSKRVCFCYDVTIFTTCILCLCVAVVVAASSLGRDVLLLVYYGTGSSFFVSHHGKGIKVRVRSARFAWIWSIFPTSNFLTSTKFHHHRPNYRILNNQKGRYATESRCTKKGNVIHGYKGRYYEWLDWRWFCPILECWPNSVSRWVTSTRYVALEK
jgi:uncharacterized membrane protein